MRVDLPSLTLRHGEGRNLVLGGAMNYSAADLYPFVRSLRRFSNCRAVLIVNNPKLVEVMHRENVDCVLLPRRRGYSPHENFERNADYYHVLSALKGEIDHVFFSDTRDVVFQGDPFLDAPDGDIVYFEEGKGVTFDSHEMSRKWLRSTFGDEIWRLVKHHEIICAGTVLARFEPALTYCWLKMLLGTMVPARRLGQRGVDQMTTNIIARLVPMQGSRVVPYDGHVATLYVGPGLHAVGDDFFARNGGYVPKVLHQYDRVPEILDWVSLRYGRPYIPGWFRVLGRIYRRFSS